MYGKALQMMYTRLGPWLGRVASKDVKFLPSLTSKLHAGSSFVGSSINDVVNWAKKSPVNAVMVATTVAGLGHSIAEFIDADDVETQSFMDDLNKVAAKASAQINKIGRSSEMAAGDLHSEERQAQTELEIEVLSWARGFFGSPALAVEGHRMLQAFVEMPLGNVRHGFATLKLK